MGSRVFLYACLLFIVSVYLLGFQPSLLIPVTVFNSGVLTPLLFLCLLLTWLEIGFQAIRFVFVGGVEAKLGLMELSF